MYHRRLINLIPAALTVAVTIILSADVYLSTCVGRIVKASEFARVSNAIVKSAFHPHEGGASKALKLAKTALSSPPSIGSIEAGGHTYTFPLPKYAVPQDREEGRFHFVAFVSPAELDDYFNRELPNAGWSHLDQMGAGHFLSSPGANMTVVQHFYLTSEISEFNVLISQRR